MKNNSFLLMLFTMSFSLFTLAGCSKTESPAPPIQTPVAEPEPVPAPPEKPRFTGTRIGPLLASISVFGDILVSHADTPEIPVEFPGSSLPRRLPRAPEVLHASVDIGITLSNDNDRVLFLDQDFIFRSDELFVVTITDEDGQRVFEEGTGLQGVQGWEAGEVKNFSVTWPVNPNMVGNYLITVRFGFGGQLATRTRLK